MAANTNYVTRRPAIVEAQDSVTRPADANQYTAGDAISDNATTATAAGYFALSLASVGGGSALLTDFTLHKSDHDVTSADFALLLFTTVPAFAGWEDNAAVAITDTEMLECKGVVRFLSADWVNVATGDVQTVSQNFGIVCASGSTTIYGILVAVGTYTPASGEVFTLTVKAAQD